jgi:hypothetical protein
MDLIGFQYDRSFVLDALRRGDIDYLEHVSEAAEADWFRHLIRRQVLQRLAETYPTPRKKEEVPLWIYLASELSLKLHGAQSYHAFPRILRSGGLIGALGPEMGGRKTRHPETGDVTVACPGFNHKNDYDRQTPCDQDFLRKFAHDTDTDRLHDGSIAKCRAVCGLSACSTPRGCLSETLPICSSPTMSTTSNPIYSGSMNTTTLWTRTRWICATSGISNTVVTSW